MSTGAEAHYLETLQEWIDLDGIVGSIGLTRWQKICVCCALCASEHTA